MNDIMTDETPQNAQNGGGTKMTPNNHFKAGKPQLKQLNTVEIMNKRRGIQGSAFLQAGVDMVPSHVRKLHRASSQEA